MHDPQIRPVSPRLLGEWTDIPRYFIVTDLIDGETLAERLKCGPMSPDEAAKLLAEVARVIDYAPRSETGEYLPRQRRPTARRRFRPCSLPRRPDRRQRPAGDIGLQFAGTTGRETTRRTMRHLESRRHPVRDADRQTALRGRQPGTAATDDPLGCGSRTSDGSASVRISFTIRRQARNIDGQVSKREKLPILKEDRDHLTTATLP